MGYTWFRAEAAAVDHPKVMELATELKIRLVHADGLVFRLWSWIHRYAPTGLFTARARPQVEQYVTAGEGPEGVLEAMQKVGLIDEVEDPETKVTTHLEAHDWWDLQGALVEKAEKDSKRKRTFRAKKRRADGARQSADRPRTVRGTARVHDGTGRDGTEQNERDVAKKARAPGEPRRSALRDSDLLEADFEDVLHQPYAWNGAKDGTALASLLAVATLAEVRARWRRGLNATGWHQVRTVAQLHSKWNDLATPPPAARGPSADAATAGEGAITMKEIRP